MRIEYYTFYESITPEYSLQIGRRYSFEKKKKFVDRNMTYVSMSVLLQFWEQLNKKKKETAHFESVLCNCAVCSRQMCSTKSEREKKKSHVPSNVKNIDAEQN